MLSLLFYIVLEEKPNISQGRALREKRLNTEFSGPYFPVFGLNRETYEVISLFSPNAGKYGPEKLRIWTFPRSGENLSCCNQ